jgi:hypothetical protein
LVEVNVSEFTLFINDTVAPGAGNYSYCFAA